MADSELVQQFMAVTGAEQPAAVFFLERCSDFFQSLLLDMTRARIHAPESTPRRVSVESRILTRPCAILCDDEVIARTLDC